MLTRQRFETETSDVAVPFAISMVDPEHTCRTRDQPLAVTVVAPDATQIHVTGQGAHRVIRMIVGTESEVYTGGESYLVLTDAIKFLEL